MKRKNQILSLLLAGVMAVTMMPAGVFAAGGRVEPEATYSSSEQQRGYQAEVTGTYKTGSGQIYYVDSEAGNDANDGKTEATAFQKLEKVNALTLQPGDSILLKKGSIFDGQQLYPKGKGTPDEHILIGTYGDSEKKPVINANYKFREALLIENMEYVDVTGLELTNDDVFNKTEAANDPSNRKDFIGKDGEYKQFRPLGVHISIDERKTDTLKISTSKEKNSDTGIVDEENRAYKGINIDGCYIHNVDGDENCDTNKLSGGIGVEVNYYNAANSSFKGSGTHPYFDGVTLQNNSIFMVDRCGIKGVRLTRLDGPGEWAGNDDTRNSNVRRTDGYNQAALNYVIRNNKLSYIGGDGILVDSTKGALCENNLMDHHTWRATGANAGIWQWNAFDTVFQYNECYAGPSYNQDGCSYDSDYWSGGTVYQYNYSHDTPMGFMLLMGNNDTDIVRYNLSQNDGLTWRHIVQADRSPSYVYNNVFYYDGAKWKFVHGNNTDNNANLSICGNFNYYNNIWYNTSTTTPSLWRIGDWNTVETKNNMVYEASGIHDSKEIPGAIHADPKFANPGGGETQKWSSLSAYKLQEGSPAIGAGSYVDVVPQGTDDYAPQWNWQTGDYNTYQDFYGNALYKGAPDIGLEESSYNANPIDIEKNGVYKFYNRDTKSYLQRDGESVSTEAEKASSQDFMVVGSGDRYKIRIWDSEINSYLYLEAVNGGLALKETSQTVWQLEDMMNGLIRITTNGSSVAAGKNTVSLQASGEDTIQQWQLQLQEHSKSYNAGGKEIEGFSADQQYQEIGKESGYVGEPKVIGNADSDSVFASGITGETLEYNIYGSKGEYTLKLYLNELEGISDRTFNILVNGKTMKEDYHLPAGEQIVELGGIYPVNGKISVKLTASYNGAGVLTSPVLCGISADRQPMTEVVSRVNAGGGAFDGLAADTAYTDKNGSGFYGDGKEITVSNTLPDPDAGMGTVLKTAREGADFGYKFKEAPGQYRVKLYFNEASGQNHKFNVLINGQTVKENYSISDAAKGNNKGTALVFETESKDGLVDISFKGIGGSKAMVNAVILEAYEPIADENLALKGGVKLEASSTASESYKALKNANDNDQATRWSTENGVSEASITVDLQTKYMLNHVMVDWTPGAYATSYHIEISEDGQEWKSAASIGEANPGLNVTELDSVVARYVKIVGEKMNDQWGMSLTELGVYGTEVRGEMGATAAVADKDEAGFHELMVGAENIYKKFSTMKVKVIYDSSKFEFAGSKDANSENQNTGSLAFNKRSDVNLDDPENAYVEYVFSIKKKDAFQEPGNVLKTTMKTLTQAREYVKVEMRLTNAEGHETTLPVVKAYMPAGVSYEALQELIGVCQNLYDNAEVGILPGQYEQKDKDILQAAIEAAKKYTAQSTSEEFQKAFSDLDGAREAFLAAQKKAQFVSYHKDYRIDSEANFTGNTATVTDNALKLSVNAGSIAVDKDAPLLAQGNLYVRFKVDNVLDQTKFIIVDDQGIKRASVGFDAGSGNWFWDSADWDEFGNAQPLQADTETELRLKYELNENNKYNLTLWINGVQIGTTYKDVAYAAGTGRLAFEARNNAKNFQILETYFTDADPVTIQVSTEGKGTASQTGTVTSFKEADKTIYFTPENGEELKSVLVDGVDVTEEVKNAGNSYTFTYLLDNHTVEATFTGGGDVPDPDEEQIIYHKDFAVDTAATYAGNLLESQELKDGQAVLKTSNGGDTNFAVAMDKESPNLDDGTFYARFVLDNIDDQTLFDLMTDGTADGSATGYIRVGFETDSKSGRAAWFCDKTGTSPGYKDFPNQTVKLEPNKEHELELQFTKQENGNYKLALTVDGISCGSIDDLIYGSQGGKYAFATRRIGKQIGIKEVYYTNQSKRIITVTSGEHGTISQTGSVTTFDGADKTFLFKPDEGYQVASVIVNGQPVDKADSYTFQNISEDASLEVTFEITEAGALRQELTEEIQKAEAVINDNYTTESWNALQTAISDAQTLLDNGSVDQEALAQAKSALANAVSGLVKNELDYRELKKLYAFGTETIDVEQDNQVYTKKSFDNYTEKKADAAKLLGEQTEPQNVNDEELQIQNPDIENAAIVTEENVISDNPPADLDESEDILMFSDGEAETEAEVVEITQEEAPYSADTDMFTAEDAFTSEESVMPEDTFVPEESQEDQTIEAEDEFIPEEIFSSEEEENLSEEEIALQADDVKQAEIDKALAELENAIRGLQPEKTMGDLEKAVFSLKMEAYALKGKVEEKYSKERWKAFKDAMVRVEELVNKETAPIDSKEIQMALEALQQTAKALPEPTSKENLQKLYDENKGKTNIGYTSTTWDEFLAALGNVETILAEPDAPQDTIDAALIRLQNAINNLTIDVPDPGPGPQPTPSPEPTPTPGPNPTPGPSPTPEPTPTPGPEDAFKAAVPEVTVKAKNLYTVSINWKAIENAGSYRVYRKETGAGAKYVALKTVGKNITSYVDKTAKPGTTYYYSVRAFWSEGGKGIKTKASADMKVTTPKLATPKAKTTVVNSNQVKITWNKVDGATTYKVWRKETNSKQGFKAVGTINAAKAASFIDKKVKYGTQYTYHVRAYRTTKTYTVKSAYTAKMTATLKVTLPAPKVTAQGKSKTSIQVKWNKLPGATGYAVYRKTGKNGSWGRIYTANSKTLTYVDKKAKKGTQYYYMVRGYQKVNGKNIYGAYSKGAAGKTK